MSKTHEIQDGTGIIVRQNTVGIAYVVNRGAPTAGKAGYAPGALWQDTTNALIYINTGTATSTTWTLLTAGSAVLGVAAGYKIARGVGALDGTNPTPITTGLATIVAATVCLDGTAAPGVGTCCLTVASTNFSTGILNVYGWKPTGSGDCTLIASTGTDAFEWIAVGT